MRNYELLYILPASETSEEIVKNFQDVQKHIEKFGGIALETLLEHPFLTKTGMSRDEEPEELKVLPLVKRKLAYPIKHEKFGYYCLVNFQAEEKKIEEIDEYLRLHSKSLRHLIVQADPMTREQLEQLQTLFARKKAEQDREEAEKESGAKEERKPIRREAEEVKPAPAPEEKKEEEKTEEIAPEAVPAPAVEEEEKAEIQEEVKAEPVEETKSEEVKEEKKAKEAKKETEPKEEKKAGRKSKIKLEELEDKLDEILEDTIV
jgi:ribosomal protein S6